MVGREQMIESYWDFMQSADISDFRVRYMDIEVSGNTAVAYYMYRLRYKIEIRNVGHAATAVMKIY